MKNVYELMMELVGMESEINKLNDELVKVNNDVDRNRIETLIDRKYASMLELKHKLERINITI